MTLTDLAIYALILFVLIEVIGNKSRFWRGFTWGFFLGFIRRRK